MTQESLPVLGTPSFRSLIANGRGPHRTPFVRWGGAWGIGRGPTAFLFLTLVLTPPAHPQGCAQCRETLGQTPIRTQQAYRRAITTLVLAGAAIFTASFVALKRFR